MSRKTKKEKEREESIRELKKLIKKGDMVYAMVRHTVRSKHRSIIACLVVGRVPMLKACKKGGIDGLRMGRGHVIMDISEIVARALSRKYSAGGSGFEKSGIAVGAWPPGLRAYALLEELSMQLFNDVKSIVKIIL